MIKFFPLFFALPNFLTDEKIASKGFLLNEFTKTDMINASTDNKDSFNHLV